MMGYGDFRLKGLLLLIALLSLIFLVAGCGGSLPGKPWIDRAQRDELALMEDRLAKRVEEDAEDGEAWRQLAWVQIRRDAPKRAEESAARAVRADPDRPEHWLALGWAQWGATHARRAMGAFSQALQLDRRLPEARLGLALSHERVGNLDTALTAIGEGLANSPDNPQLLYHGARLNHRQGKWEEARNLAARLIRQFPGHADAGDLLVDLLRRAGRLDEAVVLISQILKVDPDRRSSRQLLLAIRIEQKEWDAALRVLEAMEVEGSLVPEARMARISALEGKGDHPGSKRELDALMRARPDFLPAREAMGRLRVRQGRFQEAMTALMLPTGQTPNAGIQYWRAAAGMNWGGGKSAERALDAALKKAPGDPAVALLKIQRLVSLGRLAEAGKRLTAMARDHPGEMRTALARVDLAARAGRLKESEAALQELPPGLNGRAVAFARAFARLRLAYLRGDWEGVTRLAPPLREQPGSGWRADYLLGVAYLQLKRDRDALAVFQRRLTGKALPRGVKGGGLPRGINGGGLPPQGRPLFATMAGYLEWLGGNVRAADRTWSAELDRAPGHPLLLEALSRLMIATGNQERTRQLLEKGLNVAHPFRVLFTDRLSKGAPTGVTLIDRPAVRRFLAASPAVAQKGFKPVKGGKTLETMTHSPDRGWSVVTVLHGAFIPDRPPMFHPSVAAPPQTVPVIQGP